MPIRDFLAEEDNDARRAATRSAAHGTTMGTSQEAEPRFIDSDRVFGSRTEAPPPAVPQRPIVGERVAPMRVSRIGPELDSLLGGDDPIFRRPDQRPTERVPFGVQEQVLAYPARPGYRNYWANDIPGRIQRFKRAGYAHVLDPDTGEPVSRITDKADGRGRASYLMETPIGWYQDDMARQAAALADKLADIRQGRAGPGAGENRYIPKQGISITGGTAAR